MQLSREFDSARYNLHENEKCVVSCTAFYGITIFHVYWISTKFKSLQSNGTIKSTMRKRDMDYDKKDKSSESTGDELYNMIYWTNKEGYAKAQRHRCKTAIKHL
jgi:hypothetical protein